MSAADRLAEIEARIEAATPGPWTSAEADDVREVVVTVPPIEREPEVEVSQP